MPQTIPPQELLARLKKKDDLLLIDNRSPEEFSDWHIPGALNFPLENIPNSLSQIPKDKDLVIICNRGHTSEVATEYLVEEGFKARKLEGGLKAWNGIYEAVKVKLGQGSGPKAHRPLDEKLKVFQVKRVGKGCLSYILLTGGSKAILVDVTRHIDFFKDYLKKNSLTPIAVVDTHVHADHISGGLQLARYYKIPYLLPRKSMVSFSFDELEDKLPKLIPGIKVEIIPTPGHTLESVAILFDNTFVIAGDTLFPKSVGRSDLGEDIEKNSRLIYESVRGKLFKLKNKIIVLPAHSEDLINPGDEQISAAIFSIKKHNQIAKFSTVDEYIKYLSAQNFPTPPNYQVIKEINRSGKYIDEDLDELELGGNSCSVNTKSK